MYWVLFKKNETWSTTRKQDLLSYIHKYVLLIAGIPGRCFEYRTNAVTVQCVGRDETINCFAFSFLLYVSGDESGSCRNIATQADRQDDFFQSRLKAFEIWLESAAAGGREVAPRSLEELPVVLQILLSQVRGMST